MTALPEGENEVNIINVNDNDEENENDSSIDVAKSNTFEENKTPNGESQDEEDEDDELIEFLKKHDLMDMKSEILSSKLKLSHFKEVEKTDLDDLCNDLQLKPSQKIRLKHCIKALQKNIVRNRIREKMKCSVLSSKNKMMNLKNKRLISRKMNKSNMSYHEPNNDQIVNVDDNKYDNDDDKVRKLRSKIVIVGEAAVGKTTLQKAMMGWDFEDGMYSLYFYILFPLFVV